MSQDAIESQTEKDGRFSRRVNLVLLLGLAYLLTLGTLLHRFLIFG
ncbi:MAG: hypothetical protein R3D67_15900 [Hyphomicrobiaceae bacterium]